MIDQLELHLYPGRQPGWCLTCKQPLRDATLAAVRDAAKLWADDGELVIDYPLKIVVARK